MSIVAPIRVVVADDHPMVLASLEALIKQWPDLAVVATARDGEEAVDAVRSTKPHIAVLDVRMPKCDGLEATRRIKVERPDTSVIIISGGDDPASALRAFQAGAIGFLPKATTGRFLVEGIRMAAGGRAVVTAETVASMLTNSMPSSTPLTSREQMILELVADGQTNDKIARRLQVSVSTVKAQLTAMFEKLGATDRASAVAISFRGGWLS